MPDSPAPNGVVIPKWLFGIATSIGTVAFLGLGTWVIKTWTAPEAIAALTERVDAIEAADAKDALDDQKALSDMSQKVALMQKDLETLATDSRELRPLILEAIAK